MSPYNLSRRWYKKISFARQAEKGRYFGWKTEHFFRSTIVGNETGVEDESYVGLRPDNRWNPSYLVQTGQNGLSSIQNNLSLHFACALQKILFNY
jgi:hypothetical protein